MEIQGHPVHPGRPCPHSTGKGCDDYANRPQDPCINFNCGWVVGESPLPDWMKPDNAKVIVIFNKITWHGLPVDVAVPVGRKIPPRALNWLKDFSQRNGRPLLFSEQIKENGRFTSRQLFSAHGPVEFQQHVAELLRNDTPLW
ncbi:MAG: hypothetical protein R3E46_14090 [Sedimenticolaceae bacterium]|nr:hypothetical protein [Gammaproteobacteria bacterium]